jgi:hypothetical protein
MPAGQAVQVVLARSTTFGAAHSWHSTPHAEYVAPAHTPHDMPPGPGPSPGGQLGAPCWPIAGGPAAPPVYLERGPHCHCASPRAERYKQGIGCGWQSTATGRWTDEHVLAAVRRRQQQPSPRLLHDRWAVGQERPASARPTPQLFLYLEWHVGKLASTAHPFQRRCGL